MLLCEAFHCTSTFLWLALECVTNLNSLFSQFAYRVLAICLFVLCFIHFLHINIYYLQFFNMQVNLIWTKGFRYSCILKKGLISCCLFDDYYIGIYFRAIFFWQLFHDTIVSFVFFLISFCYLFAVLFFHTKQMVSVQRIFFCHSIFINGYLHNDELNFFK